MGEDIEIDKGIMSNKIDHAVLPDIVDDRDARQRKGEQEAREAAQDADSVDDNTPHVAFPVIGAHSVFTMKQNIACNKHSNEDDGEDDGASSSQFLHYHFPHPAQEKEENSHEYIIETEP